VKIDRHKQTQTPKRVSARSLARECNYSSNITCTEVWSRAVRLAVLFGGVCCLHITIHVL